MCTLKKQWVESGEERLAKGKSVFYDVIDVMTQDCEELEYLVLLSYRIFPYSE